MNILIVGASAGLGRALAEEAASRRHNLLLCASDGRDLAALASDLRLRHGVEAAYEAADLCREDDRSRVVRAALAWLPLDAILLPIGVSRDDDTGGLDDGSAHRMVEANFLGQVCLITALWEPLARRKVAYVVGFGSVAAARGRRRNILYAAAKRALESYFESLRAMASGGSVRIQLYRLGYLRTQQTFGRRLLLPMALPERVAKMVLSNLGGAQGNRHYPRWWALIVALLRLLPWNLYRRLDF